MLRFIDCYDVVSLYEYTTNLDVTLDGQWKLARANVDSRKIKDLKKKGGGGKKLRACTTSGAGWSWQMGECVCVWGGGGEASSNGCK